MYRQIDGLEMGSALGPLLANISWVFVGFHEKKIPAAKMREMYERYVDDMFSHFQSRGASEEFGVLLNNTSSGAIYVCTRRERFAARFGCQSDKNSQGDVNIDLP